MKKISMLLGLVALGFAYQDCTMCHNGGMAKKLDTLTPTQIEAKMKEFKAGKGNPMMVNIAKGMSETDIKDAAQKYGKK